MRLFKIDNNGNENFINPEKVIAVFVKEEQTWIELDAGGEKSKYSYGVSAKESLHEVVSRINEALSE
jgi:hypothetical protein